MLSDSQGILLYWPFHSRANPPSGHNAYSFMRLLSLGLKPRSILEYDTLGSDDA